MAAKVSINLSPKKRKKIADQSGHPAAKFIHIMNSQRAAAVSRWYSQHSKYSLEESGGNWFLQWVDQNYRRWTGEALKWTEPGLREYYFALGNPWLEKIIVEKAAQVGFTESLIALTAFALAGVKIPTGYGFEAEGKLRDVVPRIQTSLDLCPPIRKIRAARLSTTGRKDTDFKERKITVGGVECTFWYASTSSHLKGQQRQASSSLSSFTAFLQNCDEIELFPPGVLNVAEERQGACTMPTKPFRGGSSPGSEGGIVDSEVAKSGFLFQWSVVCPACKTEQFLDAFGNLLKMTKQESDSGTIEEVYLDATGRPIDWHYHDGSTRERKIDSTYLGCSTCNHELTKDVLKGGCFRCRLTHEKLVDLCDRASRTQTAMKKTVAIRLPRLASSLFNAPERLRKLIESRNPVDQLQQGLGKPASVGGGKISLKKLLQCVGRPTPDRAPDLVVMGVDQGRSFNWGMVQHWWMGEGADYEQQWLTAHKKVVWYGEISGFEGIDSLIDLWNVDLVGIDGEPEVQLAANFARRHVPDVNQPGLKGQVHLIDQVYLRGEDFKFSKRVIQDGEIPVIALHRTFGLDCVRNRIYRDLQSFPKGTTYEAGDDANLLYHYLTSDRTKQGLWVELPGLPDHFFHADNFCEAVVLAHHFQPQPRRFAFGSIEMPE